MKLVLRVRREIAEGDGHLSVRWIDVIFVEVPVVRALLGVHVVGCDGAVSVVTGRKPRQAD